MAVVVAVTFSLGFLMQANAEETAASNLGETQNSARYAADKLQGKSAEQVNLVDRASDSLVKSLLTRSLKTSSHHDADLDDATLVKPAASAMTAVLAPNHPAQLKWVSKFRDLGASHLREFHVRKYHHDLGLTGQTIGNGKYLLCKDPIRTPSGSSKIYRAYRSDARGNPIRAELTIKVSKDLESMSREAENYDRIKSGFFQGHFVKKFDFLPQIHAQPLDRCALVMETGREDLKNLLLRRNGQGLKGNALRDIAAAAAQCVHAVHSSKMVWTDLKPENLVLTGDSDSLPEVKAIDVEGATSLGTNPITYTPAACPPEWARLWFDNGPPVKLDHTFDIWSYGMLLYELSTGSGYFAGWNPAAITKSLSSKDFQVDVSNIQDGKLRDLIGQCLQIDPKKRPNVLQVLLHPYFMSTGFGPHRFAWCIAPSILILDVGLLWSIASRCV